MASKDKKSNAKAAAPKDKKAEGPKTTEFVRTDEVLKFPWDIHFANLKPGETIQFPDHEYRTVRDRAVQWSKKNDVVLATAVVKDVPTVLRVAE